MVEALTLVYLTLISLVAVAAGLNICISCYLICMCMELKRPLHEEDNDEEGEFAMIEIPQFGITDQFVPFPSDLNNNICRFV